MLKKGTRGQLRKHKWVSLEKTLSNPSQTLKRYKDECIVGLQDIALIAEKIPEGTQDEIFTLSKLQPMIEAILNLKFDWTHSPSVNRLDARRTQLSSMMLTKSIQFLKLQYEFLEHDTPGLARIVLDHLDAAVRISNEISNKVELLSLKNVANRSKLEFLFNWKKVTKEDERLWSYLSRELGGTFGIDTITRSYNDRSLRIKLVGTFGEEYSIVTIKIIGDTEKAMLEFSEGSKKIQRELALQTVNDELYVFREFKS